VVSASQAPDRRRKHLGSAPKRQSPFCSHVHEENRDANSEGVNGAVEQGTAASRNQRLVKFVRQGIDESDGYTCMGRRAMPLESPLAGLKTQYSATWAKLRTKTFSIFKVPAETSAWNRPSIANRIDPDRSELKASVERWNIPVAQIAVALHQKAARSNHRKALKMAGISGIPRHPHVSRTGNPSSPDDANARSTARRHGFSAELTENLDPRTRSN
jgi:hypothetical protein